MKKTELKTKLKKSFGYSQFATGNLVIYKYNVSGFHNRHLAVETNIKRENTDRQMGNKRQTPSYGKLDTSTIYLFSSQNVTLE